MNTKVEPSTNAEQSASQSPSGQEDLITPKVLAYLVTLGFFGILAFMLLWPVPESGHEVLLVMIGALGASWSMIIGYYFGSSAGSARKSQLLAQQQHP